MYSKINLSQVNQESYIPAWIRFLFTVVVTLLLVVISAPFPMQELIFTKDFYHSIIVNYIMAGPIVWAIHQCNKSLDVYYPWQQRPGLRCLLQLLFGVIGMLYINVLLVKTVFSIYDIDFVASGFMANLFPINVVMVGAANVFLFIRQRRSYRKHQRMVEEAYEKQHRTLSLRVLPLPFESIFNFTFYQGQQLSALKAVAQIMPPKLHGHLSLLGFTLYRGQALYLVKHLMKAVLVPSTPLVRILSIAVYKGQDLFFGKTLVKLFIPKKNYFTFLEGTHAKGKIRVAIAEVVYIQASSGYGIFTLNNQSVYTMRYKAKELRVGLDPAVFGEAFGCRFYAYAIVSAVDLRKGASILYIKPEMAFITHRAMSRRFEKNFADRHKEFLSGQ